MPAAPLAPAPHLLADPQEIAARLSDPGLRLIDAASGREPRPEGASLYRHEGEAWAARRIPGSRYLHMVDDLSDPDADVPFTLARPEAVLARLAALGIPHDAEIVLYGRGAESPVHRAWWVLTVCGCPNVRVLDGGLSEWTRLGLPVEEGAPDAPAPAPAGSPAPRRELIADRARVAAAMEAPDTALVNALPRALFEGRGDQVFGRRGRIPGSLSLPIGELIDPETQRFRPLPELQAAFDGLDLDRFESLIPYCGGGIAATTLAFALALAGFRNVAVYDGSLMEWGADPQAPMETGPA